MPNAKCNPNTGMFEQTKGVVKVAKLAREHNDANILILPARFVSEEEGIEILRTWLTTQFAGGRHSRRLEKIDREDG